MLIKSQDTSRNNYFLKTWSNSKAERITYKNKTMSFTVLSFDMKYLKAAYCHREKFGCLSFIYWKQCWNEQLHVFSL